MTTLAPQTTADSFSIAPETSLGAVLLTVADLARSEAFYRATLGLQSKRTARGLELSADGKTPLLILTELKGARRKPSRSTGLYHFALLLPSRQDLANTLHRLVAARYPLTGASDHLVSEALYLDDPDGNGIEIYRDRPRSEWNYERSGAIRMAVEALDLRALLNEAATDGAADAGIAAETAIGHVHLHVAGIESAKAFYHGVLGFDIMTDALPGALFVAAGGYHHHLGLNTWAGAGAPPPPADSVGLRQYTINVPTVAELERLAARIDDAGIRFERSDNGILVRDPSQNLILLASLGAK